MASPRTSEKTSSVRVHPMSLPLTPDHGPVRAGEGDSRVEPVLTPTGSTVIHTHTAAAFPVRGLHTVCEAERFGVCFHGKSLTSSKLHRSHAPQGTEHGRHSRGCLGSLPGQRPRRSCFSHGTPRCLCWCPARVGHPACLPPCLDPSIRRVPASSASPLSSAGHLGDSSLSCDYE